eukprot:XP_025008211.1 non-homologous end-joining factor 1 isoform X3 [Gallus gallus]
MEHSEELESRLLTQPWASVCFDESTFIAKACFGDTGYMLLISDLSGVWYESADAEAVGQRSKVCRHLVRPLVRMSLALQHQVQELTSLLLRKDAEIEDYRESGATLSRDRLRTEPFQEETFLQNIMAESLPQICSAEDGHAFTSALPQLYMAVTLQEAKQARKRHHPADLLPSAEAPATRGQGQAEEGERALQLKGWVAAAVLRVSAPAAPERGCVDHHLPSASSTSPCGSFWGHSPLAGRWSFLSAC